MHRSSSSSSSRCSAFQTMGIYILLWFSFFDDIINNLFIKSIAIPLPGTFPPLYYSVSSVGSVGVQIFITDEA